MEAHNRKPIECHLNHHIMTKGDPDNPYPAVDVFTQEGQFLREITGNTIQDARERACLYIEGRMVPDRLIPERKDLMIDVYGRTLLLTRSGTLWGGRTYFVTDLETGTMEEDDNCYSAAGILLHLYLDIPANWRDALKLFYCCTFRI